MNVTARPLVKPTNSGSQRILRRGAAAHAAVHPAPSPATPTEPRDLGAPPIAQVSEGTGEPTPHANQITTAFPSAAAAR